jgi:hypothetical protein
MNCDRDEMISWILEIIPNLKNNQIHQIYEFMLMELKLEGEE